MFISESLELELLLNLESIIKLNCAQAYDLLQLLSISTKHKHTGTLYTSADPINADQCGLPKSRSMCIKIDFLNPDHYGSMQIFQIQINVKRCELS